MCAGFGNLEILEGLEILRDLRSFWEFEGLWVPKDSLCSFEFREIFIPGGCQKLISRD